MNAQTPLDQFPHRDVISPVGEIEEPTSLLDRLTIAGKVRIAVLGNAIGFALVMAATIGLASHFGNRGAVQSEVAGAEVAINHAALRLADAHNLLRDHSDDYRATRLSSSTAALERAIDRYDYAEQWSASLPPALRASTREQRERAARLHEKMGSGAMSGPELDTARTELRSLYSDTAAHADAMHHYASRTVNELIDAISLFVVVFLCILVSAIALSTFVSRRIVRHIAGAIDQITTALQKLMDGDVASEIPGCHRQDEIGAMARGVELTRRTGLQLREAEKARAAAAERELAVQQDAAERKAATQAERDTMLRGLADGFEAHLGEVIDAVAAATVQLKATARSMAELASNSTEQASLAASAMTETVEGVDAATAAADLVGTSIYRISQQAIESAALAREADEVAHATNDRIAELSSAASEVGEILDLIRTIAQRTNLLALNASIEAARGGQNGRGFAVVASEVKELANQTSAATGEVASKIGAIQDTTSHSVSDLAAIVRQIEALEKSSVLIASAVDEQSASGERLARNINAVSLGSSTVAERIERLHEASNATGSAAERVLVSVDKLERHASALKGSAAQFLEQVRSTAERRDQAA